MSGDEPRRSNRATKGQHKNASASPGPKEKAIGKGKRGKKADQEEPEQDEEEGAIRCICGNNEENDEVPFIQCDDCKAWQHNICMGMPDDDDDLPEQYFCEQCRPEDHSETLAALKRGDKIWETRNKLHEQWEADKKKKRKSKSAGPAPTWLKQDVTEPEVMEQEQEQEQEQEVEGVEEEGEAKTAVKENGSKRKRAAKEEPETAPQEVVKPAKRQAKGRKSEPVQKMEASEDPDTALLPIDKLPEDRQKIARLFSGIMLDVIKDEQLAVSNQQTPESLADHHASRLEYALKMNHTAGKAYNTQFRALNANLKKNKALTLGLVDGSLTADVLSTMSSSDMASDELQKERAAMKAEADRQAMIEQHTDAPRYRRTHKGDEIVESEAAASSSAPVARPVRHSVSEVEMAGSPVEKVESTPNDERRASNQTFDMKDIWAKTGPATRPLQIPTRRQSSMQTPTDGAKVDADVDRLLADDDEEEPYSPQDHPSDIVWHGELVQAPGELEPKVNARWVAGRDISATVPWKQVLPSKLIIDGRLQVEKAESYLCGLQYSKTSDASVLALTAYNDADAFNTVFDYFMKRGRYAVVNKDKLASLVKDVYVIPVEAGATKLPEHLEVLTHNTIQKPVEERLLLATIVVARDPGDVITPIASNNPIKVESNGQQPYRSQSMQGPAASPIAAGEATFANSLSNANPQSGTNVHPEVMKMAVEILGELYTCPVAQQVLAEPHLTREQLFNMRAIFEQDTAARQDLTVFTQHLFQQR